VPDSDSCTATSCEYGCEFAPFERSKDLLLVVGASYRFGTGLLGLSLSSSLRRSIIVFRNT
jgi:hypothetical protein